MKKLFALFLAVILLFGCLPIAQAAEDRQFFFELSVDGSDTKQVKTGDVITVTFYLQRMDSESAYDMHAMQNEIRYDSNFLRLVEGSALLSDGIQTSDLGLRDEHREFYMNYLSLSGGEQWPARRLVGSFQLEVIAEAGVTKITNQDYLVSASDGKSHYKATCQDITLILTTECTVTFVSNGGTEVPSQVVSYGDLVAKPEDPVREGYVLKGWYSDIDMKDRWDFDEDTVQGNMTLYAKWSKAEVPVEDSGSGFGWLWLLLALIALLALLALLLLFLLGRKTVRFETGCSQKIKTQRVRKGDYAQRPENPVRPGRMFVGWYADEAKMVPWNFEEDAVESSITLYAKWL